jgi:hypothetical protein
MIPWANTEAKGTVTPLGMTAQDFATTWHRKLLVNKILDGLGAYNSLIALF